MITTTLIIFALGVSFFCVGLRIITSKDMILYWMRKPYEKLKTYIDEEKGLLADSKKFREELQKKFDYMYGSDDPIWEEKCDSIMFDIRKMDENIVTSIERIAFATLGVWLMKPIVGCVTCMASVWTITFGFIFYADLNWKIILPMMMVAFFFFFFYATYEMIVAIKNRKCNC
ncbi:MAG: hypothetical protein ACTSQZ_05000 [Candidatus Thorarchaeota archaeon]